MNWSIRARLTTWYSLVVIAVLITSAMGVAVVERRMASERLDEELERLMMTLDGVMKTEFGEGLNLQESADEASIEVVGPDRVLVLVDPGGALLAMWGLPFPRSWRPDMERAVSDTLAADGRLYRRFSHPVSVGQHRYVAAVMAPLEEFEEEQTELTAALAIGALLGLVVAVVGGWIVGHQTLKPLAAMAGQATAITERELTGRLVAPNSGDELGQFAASFNELLDRLAAALHSQRQFMADASHELRTPVSVVRTTAQVTMARTQRSEDDYRESFTIVSEQATRLARLVDAMFLLSRAEANGLPLTPVPLYLDDLVGDCVRACRVLADERGVVVDVTGSSEQTFVGDDLLLRQMIGNLLDNAIRHALPGGHVSVVIATHAQSISIAISNDGDAIPPNQRERIFERFVRLDPQSKGAGLGLPIARWIAEAHGGRLTLDTSSAARTTFVVVLPVSSSVIVP
jgi:signal transduction histidine kinase